MGLLDYGEFGNSKLGYQPQIQQFSDSITEILRARQAKAKLDEERAYHQAEVEQRRTHDNATIALKNQETLAAEARRAEEQKRFDANRGAEGTKALLERLRAGDVEGGVALGGAYGVQRSAPPAPPEEPAQAPRALPPEVRPQIPDTASEKPPGQEGDVDAVSGSPVKPTEPPPFDPGVEAPPARPKTPTQSASGAASGYSGKMGFDLPGGGSFSVDPETQRVGNRAQLAEDFKAQHRVVAEAKFRSAGGRPPEVAAQIRAEAQQDMADIDRVAAHIASGAAVPSAAGGELEAGVRQRRAEGFQAGEGDKNRAAAMARTQVMASAANGRHADTLPPAGEPDPKVQSRYQADVAEIKNNTLTKADLKQLRSDREALAALADPSGPGFQLATDAMVKAATGGRVSVTLEQNYLKAMGLLTGAENWAYKQTHGGKSMPAVVATFRKIAAAANHEIGTQLQSDAAAFEEKAGVKSHWFQRPEMRAYVLDNRRAHYQALGLPVPPDPQPQARGAPAQDDDEAFIDGR